MFESWKLKYRREEAVLSRKKCFGLRNYSVPVTVTVLQLSSVVIYNYFFLIIFAYHFIILREKDLKNKNMSKKNSFIISIYDNNANLIRKQWTIYIYLLSPLCSTEIYVHTRSVVGRGKHMKYVL